MAILKVNTKYGTIIGKPTDYQASSCFLGIPYAAPPVGRLRWKPPQPIDPWDGERKAYTYSSIPIQSRPVKGEFYSDEFYPINWPMNEDCLYLNVVTPAENATEKLPVVLWIYGGGFSKGYSQKVEVDGKAFAERGIVFVSFNYRVNIFGYFLHDDLDKESDYNGSGNYGLLDQIAALRWVYKNISAFGGDPDKITIMGQSAGAMSVYDLLCSPLSERMIAGAIMESGGGPVTGDGSSEPSVLRRYCSRFLDFINCETVEQARSISAEKLYESYLLFQETDPAGSLMLHPVPDGYSLLLPTRSVFSSGNYADVPTLLGTTADEDSNFDSSSTKMRDGFLGGALAYCMKQKELNRSSCYLYHLTNVPPGKPERGAFHSGEHFYIFQTLLASKRPFTGIDFDLSNNMCDYWSNFIKTGDPNCNSLPKWDSFNSSGKAMQFDRLTSREMMDIPEYGGIPLKIAQDAL